MGATVSCSTENICTGDGPMSALMVQLHTLIESRDCSWLHDVSGARNSEMKQSTDDQTNWLTTRWPDLDNKAHRCMHTAQNCLTREKGILLCIQSKV